MKSKSKVVAVIQARMRSGRLPAKVLLPLAEMPVLWWMVKRVISAELVDQVVIATTSHPANAPIFQFCHVVDRIGLYINQPSCFQYHGDEDDVIGRVLAAAEGIGADIIVDITADCPMVDPRHIDYLINYLDSQKWDYVSNDIIKRSWPDGLDIQVYPTEILKKCKKLYNPKQHCGWNIAQYPDVFIAGNWSAPSEMHWPELGLTLDTQEDYYMLKALFMEFGDDPLFRVEDVVKLLKENPELITNKDVRRKTPEEG